MVIVARSPFHPLDETYRLNGHLIKQWYWVARLDVKECCNHATNVRANLHDVIHARDFSKSFNPCLQCFMIRFDEVQLTLIFSNLLSFAIRVDLGDVTLTNKAQDGNRTHLKIQRIKI